MVCLSMATKVWICANHDVIAVNIQNQNIVDDGTWSTAEFIDLVYNHSNDKVKAFIEQYV